MTDVQAFMRHDLAVATREDAAPFEIEIYRDVEAIDGDWKALEADAVLTPFQTRAWLLPFYRELAPRMQAKPILVLVRDRLTRRPLMLLPLCARRYYGVMIVQFADLGVSDYNAPIIAKNFDPTPAQWRRLFRKILASLKDGSILRLKNMPRLIGGRPNPLVQHNKRSNVMEVSSWGVNLPLNTADYDKRILSASFVKELAKKHRRLAKLGAIEFVVAQTQDEKRLAFDLLVRQRQARCDDMGRFNVLTQDAYHQFYYAAAVASADSLTCLALLKVGGEAVGTVFALRHRDGFHVIMSTFESGDWKSYSLGNIGIRSAVDHCIDTGVGYFDLTIGNEDYKQRFGATPNPLYASLQPLTAFGAFLVLSVAAGTKIGKALMRIPSFRNKTKFGLSPERSNEQLG